jgi:iron donor protein CyaY
MLSDQSFQQKCSDSLEGLFSKLAAVSGDFDFDVDMQAGALTIEFEDPPQRFVVSPNSPVRQVWVSANVQSFKLEWDEQAGAFVLPATAQTLEQVMVDAVRKRIPDFQL